VPLSIAMVLNNFWVRAHFPRLEIAQLPLTVGGNPENPATENPVSVQITARILN
jgi:hypothetical protein